LPPRSSRLNLRHGYRPDESQDFIGDTPGLAGWTRAMVEDPHNWDFSPVPADQRGFCLGYEIQRHSDMLRSLVLQGRRKFGLRSFDEAAEHAYSNTGEAGLYFLVYPFAWCFEWPDQPYLSIPPAERRRRLKEYNLHGAVARGGFNSALLAKGAHWLRRIQDGTLSRNCDVKLGHVRLKDLSPEQSRQLFVKDPEHEVLLTIPINLRQPPTEVGRFVSGFVRRLQRGAGITPIRATGGGSRTREALADLKALGAYRLLGFMDWEAASDLTATVGGRDEPLFTGQSKWIAARKRAEILLRP
jgi:hypothetical protein